MKCPICDGPCDVLETVKPALGADGMMVPLPQKFQTCHDCGTAFAGAAELNFNAAQAHLLLNQFCVLDAPEFARVLL